MNNITTLLIVLGVVCVVAVVLGLLLPYLKRRGVNVAAALDSAKAALDSTRGAFETLRPFLQESPSVSAFDKLLTAAHVGVGNAEQLYNIGQLEPGQRKEAARQYILDATKLMGVEVTPEVKKLIDGAIEAEVLELGHLKDKLLPANPTPTE